MATLPKPKMGRPTSLTEPVMQLIVEQIRERLSVSNAARIARVHPESIKNWIEQGFKDIKDKKDTIFAHFFVNIREAQGKKVAEMLKKIEEGQKNWQGIAWILEKCCADEFGKDSELYRQLLEDYKKLMEDMINRKNTPVQG